MTKLTSLLEIDQKDFRPMHKHETEAMVTMMMAEHKTGGDPLENTLEKVKQIGFSAGMMLLPRLINAKVNITGEAAIWIASLCSRPGDVTMWAWTLFDYGRKHPNTRIDLNLLPGLMPMGVPSEDDYLTAWDAQKLNPSSDMYAPGRDNLLDHPSSWR